MKQKNIVICGGGAGGLELAVGLAKKYSNKKYIVKLIDKERTHVWKPHLHEVAAGTIDSHLEQVDYLNLANKFGFEFIWSEMTHLDKENKLITLKQKLNSSGEEILPERTLSYDYMIMSIGSISNDFGTKGVKEFSYSLDSLESANEFHQHMLEKIMQKEYSHNSEAFKITVIGGGATGTELSASLSDTTQKLSKFNLPKLKNNPIRITIVNAANQLLPGLSQKISHGAQEILQDINVNILNSATVTQITKNTTHIKQFDKEITLTSDLIVWAAGVKSPEFLSHLGLATNKGNQLVVTPQLKTSDPYIFAIGDCASADWIHPTKEGLKVPPRAQAAHQMSSYLVKSMDKIIKGKSAPNFVYKDFGSLISLGENETVGTLMGFMKGKSLFIEGKIAKFMYLNLYQHHQIQINGMIPALALLISKLIQKQFKPKIKLH